ncbi:acetyl-CoA C-acetyltransferase [Acidaminobacter sp. JC074]|uniref:acetyl-CoA C-acetyltransferase n=1 Tax=Acidaminobacter sp. JC074 TaxID=2530199 RepID=UPI001F0FF507|nr:acetyl-CoA C-acetyltransferase [Acidaminobacter sp. JC074]MCH4886017.1 acetyl-CoA C-acetyltransferase [Acidaminobacter sp. JC074]
MKVYILDAKRSPIGSFLGSLKKEHPADVGAKVLTSMLKDLPVDVNAIDEVLIGNILPAGLRQGVGRQVSIKAGIPDHVPAYSLNMVCGSGMKTVINAFTNVKAGLGNLYVAGGVEHMSRAPFITSCSVRNGQKLGPIKQEDHIIYDALTDAFNDIHMGITAENIAEKYQISRQAQDDFAYTSQKRAIKAIDEGRFKDEIIPVEVKPGREVLVFDTDEYVNYKTTSEKLAKLRPAFKKDGTVTAGNASGINDGASMVIVASEAMVEKQGLNPMCEIISVGQGGVDPTIMGMGPVPAIRQALKRAGLELKDMDLIELNEAFAAQSLGVMEELIKEHEVDREWLSEITNVNGGAIALGHPVGSSGNRILVTLIHEMKKRKATYGLASLCIGGGMGTAIIVKM